MKISRIDTLKCVVEYDILRVHYQKWHGAQQKSKKEKKNEERNIVRADKAHVKEFAHPCCLLDTSQILLLRFNEKLTSVTTRKTLCSLHPCVHHD